MDKDEIRAIAMEAGIFAYGDIRLDAEDIERFAALVAEKEREACARLCVDVSNVGFKDDHWYHASEKCAAAIRARKP